MRKKDLFSIIYMSVLTLLALIYGFTTIPSPVVQRQITLDHRRVSDLGEIKSSIETYYANHKHLPTSLNDLPPSTAMHRNDPESKQPYEYTILNKTPPYIQLCANFVTNSHKDDPDESDSTNYDWTAYSGDYQHPAGHYCFKLNISYYAPTPDVSETPAPVTVTPVLPKRPVSDHPKSQ